AELVRIGADYLRIASWSYLIMGVSWCYLAIMRVTEHAVCSAMVSFGAVVGNIILNAICIFGFCGVPAMGANGAAVATVLARILELAACVLICTGKTFIPLRIKTLLTFNFALFLDFWKYTLPILGSFLLWGVGFTAYTALMGHMGEDAAAANAVAAVVRDLMCCLCNGLAGGAGILIGNELGAGNLVRGKLYGERTMILSFITGLANTVLILASIPLVTLFCSKLTPQAHHYMVGMFVILSVYMIGRCVCTVVINGIFSAGGDTLFDVYSLAVCMWGIALPCAFAGYYLGWHVLLVYACTCLDEVGKIPWVIWHYRRYKWVKNITRD
ncbi:MAG: MATE family efflux transporter, partial [Lentisphaeria bacterium]|nr:MATE family efflux transporter [Lentisphaeria bacterium]